LDRSKSVLEIEDLTVRFDIRNELLFRVTTRAHAVEKVSLVGEAGRGKSTIGQTFYQPHDPVSGAMRS
jgi:glutathione transport system ATP-binding protein